MATVLGRNPRLLDIGIAAVLVTGGLLEGAVTETSRPLWLHQVLVVVIMSAVALRRRFPLATVGFVVVGMMVVDPNGQLSTFAALVIVTFTAGLEVDPPRSYWAWSWPPSRRAAAAARRDAVTSSALNGSQARR